MQTTTNTEAHKPSRTARSVSRTEADRLVAGLKADRRLDDLTTARGVAFSTTLADMGDLACRLYLGTSIDWDPDRRVPCRLVEVRDAEGKPALLVILAEGRLEVLVACEPGPCSLTAELERSGLTVEWLPGQGPQHEGGQR